MVLGWMMRPFALRLHLGNNVCVPYMYRCGFQVDAHELARLHCLTFKLAPGRIARHQTLNNAVTRAFASTGISVT